MSRDLLSKDESIYPFVELKKLPSILPTISSYKADITDSVDTLHFDQPIAPSKLRRALLRDKIETKKKTGNKVVKSQTVSKKRIEIKLPPLFKLHKLGARNIAKDTSTLKESESLPKSSFFVTSNSCDLNSESTEEKEVGNLKCSFKKKQRTINKTIQEINLNSSQMNNNLLTELQSLSEYNKGMISKCNLVLSNLDKKNNINTDEYLTTDVKEKRRYDFYKSLDLVISKLHNVDYMTLQRMLHELKEKTESKRKLKQDQRAKLHSKILKLLDQNYISLKNIVNKS